jgi:hypothetical protein
VARWLSCLLATALLIAGCAVPAERAVEANSASPTTATTMRRSAPPPVEIPDVALLTRNGERVQQGELFASTWIVDGAIEAAAPRLPLRWPAPVRHRPSDEVLLNLNSTPPPAWVDIRVYATVDRNGAPSGVPLHVVTCDPGSADPCATGDGGDATVRLSVPSGGRRLITVNAAWPIPTATARTIHMPRTVVSARASWLFSLTV